MRVGRAGPGAGEGARGRGKVGEADLQGVGEAALRHVRGQFGAVERTN